MSLIAYVKTLWKDHIVDPVTKKVTQKGTDQSEKNFNKIEKGVFDVTEHVLERGVDWDAAKAHADTTTGNPHQVTASETGALPTSHPASAVTTQRVLNWDLAKDHADSAHAPSDAEKNPDKAIKVEAEEATDDNKYMTPKQTKASIQHWAPGDSGLALGETEDTAYRGDRGKTAYDHSGSAHAPSDANNYVHPGSIQCNAINYVHPANIQCTNGIDIPSNQVILGIKAFYNAIGTIFRHSIEKDGIIVKGRDGGTNDYNVTLTTEALSDHREVKLPNDSGILALTKTVSIQDIEGNFYKTVIKELQSAVYGGTIYAIAIDDDYVYMAGTITRKVRKLNIADLSFVAESADYGGSINILAIDTNFVYVGGTTTQTVRKLNIADLSLAAESADYGGNLTSLTIDNDYVYVVGHNISGDKKVKKLNIADLSLAAESADYGGTIHAIAIDTNFVYIGGATTQTVRKLNIADLSFVIDSAVYGGTIYSIAIDDNFVYVGGATTQRVRKLNIADLSLAAESANYGTNSIIRKIVIDDNFVYIGGSTHTGYPKTVKKLNIADLSLAAESADYGGTIYAIAIDTNFVYVGGLTTQTVRKLLKVNVKTLYQSHGLLKMV